MSFSVSQITKTKALEVNEGLSDDDKPAFVDQYDRYIVKSSFAETSSLIGKDDVLSSFNITQAENDGTMPVVKTKRIYP